MKTKLEKRTDKINIQKREITKEIMDAVCKRKSKLNNRKLDKKLVKYAKQMIKLEKKRFNIHKNVRVKKLKSNTSLGSMNYSSTPKVKLNIARVKKHLKSDDIQERVNGFVGYMQTIHHEMTHLEQHIATEDVRKIENINSEEALKYAREFAVKSYFGNDYYKEGDNYRKQYIERNARQKGFYDAIGVLGKEAKKDKINNALKMSLYGRIDDDFVDTEPLEFNDFMGDRDYITSTLADEAIRNNPKLLKKMPILSKEYNKDGSRKEVYQVIRDNAKALNKIKNNPFYNSKQRKEKLEEASNMYSSIFINTMNASDEKDFIKAEKLLGSRALKGMFNEANKYCKRSAQKLTQKAREEAEVRIDIEQSEYEAKKVYDIRLAAIEQKFREDIEDLSRKEAFFEDGGFRTKQLSSEEVKKQIKIDELKIENNRKVNRIRGTRKNAAQPKLAFESNEIEIDLNSAKDLSKEYENHKKNLEVERDNYKSEYEYLKAKKELEDNTPKKDKEIIEKQMEK